MKVLLVAPAPPPVGGIESVTDNLMNYLKSNPNGTDLTLLNTSHRFRPVTSQSLIVRVYSGILNAVRTYVSVLLMIKKNKPDIIHMASSASWALYKDLMIIGIANKSKIPIVMHWHFGRIPMLREKRNWEWRLITKVINKSAVSIVIDDKSYDVLAEEGFLKITNIPNPLALEVERKSKKILVEPARRTKGRLIYVGHIIKDKGVFELVEACTRIPDVTELILIGPYENNVKEELVNIAKVRSGASWLTFTGALDINQVLKYMKGSPVLALPSYTEGFPMVILEAMAMGCAIIATDVGGIPEMIGATTDSACGVCIPAKNVDKLQESILNLYRNQPEMATLGNKGISRVLNNYSMERVFLQYNETWKKAILQYHNL